MEDGRRGPRPKVSPSLALLLFSCEFDALHQEKRYHVVVLQLIDRLSFKDQRVIREDLDHFWMSDLIGGSAAEEDAKRPEWLRPNVLEQALSR